MFFFNLLPGVEGSAQPAGVRHVLAECQSAIDVKIFALQVDYAEVGILVNEALGLLFESLDRLIIPPVCVVSYLIVVAPVGIEGCRRQLQPSE